MDINKFLVDAASISSGSIVIEIVNSALASEDSNKLELTVAAGIDVNVSIDISDNNINLEDAQTFEVDENTINVVYDLFVQKETPIAQFKLLVDDVVHPVIIKNIP